MKRMLKLLKPVCNNTDGPVPFSFLIHFRHQVKDDAALFWEPLRRIPEKWYRKFLDKLNIPAFRWSKVVLKGGMNLGRLDLVPLNASLMLQKGRKEMTRRIEKDIDRLVKKGTRVIGLGALTAPMTQGGLALRHRTDVCLTNGNAFTAVIMYQAIERIIRQRGMLAPSIAVVGASGSVGSCVCRLIAREMATDDLLLIARNQKRLDKLQKELNRYAVYVDTANSIDQVKEADIVVLLTASADCLLKSEHLKDGAIVLDGTQPRNTSASLLTERPDVSIIDGGLVEIPGIDLKGGSFGLPEDMYFACFSETLLLAMDGRKEHFCLGNPSLEQADYILSLADKYKDFGFYLAPFTSFGKPVTLTRTFSQSLRKIKAA
jgi:predicted amino acid dehydrogenase